ncbi:hypothetical protein [Streptomyces wuyuanensis]|uniref:hypothetical protein n=1 Tax=Streptomyces wuyuanensis TaxID=1196353 RepID=UPI003D71075B
MAPSTNATEELGSTYVVVDTGRWFSDGHVLLPAGTIVRVDRDEEELLVNRTRVTRSRTPRMRPGPPPRDSQYRKYVADYYRPSTADASHSSAAQRGWYGRALRPV